METLLFGRTRTIDDERKAKAKGDSLGRAMRLPMSRFCGLDLGS